MFFFNDTATTEIYTLSLHDALPISIRTGGRSSGAGPFRGGGRADSPPRQVRARGEKTRAAAKGAVPPRSEEHTPELQSRQYLVCRLLLEKNQPNPRAMRSRRE